MKIKYSDIKLKAMYVENESQVQVFTQDEELFFHWQQGSRTINTQFGETQGGRDIDCFGLSAQTKPTVRSIKSCIVTYINENSQK